MGIYDRDYWQAPPQQTRFGSVQMWSVNTWIIAINIAVFLLDSVLDHAGLGYNVQYIYGNYVFRDHFAPLNYWGHFSAYTAIENLQLWRFITFQFLHANLQHILFNMFALYFFGPIIENFLGSRRYLFFYLICGTAGGVSYLILLMLHILVSAPWVPLVGASAGIFGVLMAAAQIAPDATVLIYGIIPMRLRMMAWLLLAVAVYTTFTGGANAGGEAAHLGGAAAGFWLIRSPKILNLLDFRRRPRMRIG
jgi:membrane associated rhomboid family serine protease